MNKRKLSLDSLMLRRHSNRSASTLSKPRTLALNKVEGLTRGASNGLFQAKKYAFLLLKYRLRSEKEIHQRLKQKNYSEAIIKDTLLFLKNKGFIDDSLFTKIWIQNRINQGHGPKKIKDELKFKGIDDKIIDSRFRETSKEYSEENAALEVAQKRLIRLKGIEPQKAKQRIFAYLGRRGFSPDVIINITDSLNEVISKNAG